MEYAANAYNQMPSVESGMAPIYLFTKATVPDQQLEDLHVGLSLKYLIDICKGENMWLTCYTKKITQTQFHSFALHWYSH